MIEIQGELYPYLVLPNLDIKLILFGILYDQDQQKCHTILIFETFLYKNRDCPDKVNVPAFKNCLKRISQIEYFSAKKHYFRYTL